MRKKKLSGRKLSFFLAAIAVIGCTYVLVTNNSDNGSLIAKPFKFFAQVRAARSLVSIAGNPNQRLARTRAIIRNSTASNPEVLKILFYGQSITSPKWTDVASDYLRKQYPNTHFLIENMAIGGFSTTLLEQTTSRDVSDFYPDLIVLHVYGDHRAYERIIRIMRSSTAAEIIVETDHLTGPPEPLCDEGFHFTMDTEPGCRGVLWYRQRTWDEHMSGVVLPELAQKYALVVEPRRAQWGRYIKANGLRPEQLLADAVHPNTAGWQLAARIFEDYFDSVVRETGSNESKLTSTLARPLTDAPTTYKFFGNRVEIIASKPLDGLVTSSIDGIATELIDGCWQVTRTNSLPGVPDWPVIRKVTVFKKPLAPGSWTATLTNISPDQKNFDFNVVDQLSGDSDQGNSHKDFRSALIGVEIKSNTWSVSQGFSEHQKAVPEGFQVRWSRALVCHDEKTIDVTIGYSETRHVLATGLLPGQHSLTLQVVGSALSFIREIRVYTPPLVEQENKASGD